MLGQLGLELPDLAAILHLLVVTPLGGAVRGVGVSGVGGFGLRGRKLTEMGFCQLNCRRDVGEGDSFAADDGSSQRVVGLPPRTPFLPLSFCLLPDHFVLQ